VLASSPAVFTGNSTPSPSKFEVVRKKQKLVIAVAKPAQDKK